MHDREAEMQSQTFPIKLLLPPSALVAEWTCLRPSLSSLHGLKAGCWDSAASRHRRGACAEDTYVHRRVVVLLDADTTGMQPLGAALTLNHHAAVGIAKATDATSTFSRT